MKHTFVGAGWSYPARIDATGGVALVNKDREIEEAIRIVLGTAPGERPMRPEFGCRIHDHVFAPISSSTAGQMVFDVRSALERWEPRIEIKDIRVGFDNNSEGVIYLDLRYTIRGMNDPHNLVFPFYVIPDEIPSTPPAGFLTAGR